MNKYAEEMQKVALNRLARHLSENPATVEKLTRMFTDHAASREVPTQVIRGSAVGKADGKAVQVLSPETRRANQRAMEATRPMLRTPSQYANGMWKGVEKRIPEEMGRLGVPPENIHDDSHFGAHVADINASLGKATVAHGKVAPLSPRFKTDTEVGRRKVQQAEEAGNNLHGVLQQHVGHGYVGRYEPDEHILEAGAHGGGIKLGDKAFIDALPKGVRPYIPGQDGKNGVSVALLNISKNPDIARTGVNNRTALGAIQHASVAHHEMDEMRSIASPSAGLLQPSYFTHNSPTILGREAQRAYGNPYGHLSTDVGSVQAIREASGEQRATNSLVKGRKPETAVGRAPVSGSQMKAMGKVPASRYAEIQGTYGKTGYGEDLRRIERRADAYYGRMEDPPAVGDASISPFSREVPLSALPPRIRSARSTFQAPKSALQRMKDKLKGVLSPSKAPESYTSVADAIKRTTGRE